MELPNLSSFCQDIEAGSFGMIGVFEEIKVEVTSYEYFTVLGPVKLRQNPRIKVFYLLTFHFSVIMPHFLRKSVFKSIVGLN